MAGTINFGLHLDSPEERENLRREASAETVARYQNSLIRRPISLDDFYYGLPLAARDENPHRAMSNLRYSAGFLSDGDQKKLPWYLRSDADQRDVSAFIRNNPKAGAWATDPQLVRLYGDKVKPIGTLERYWENTFGAVGRGARQGYMMEEFGYQAALKLDLMADESGRAELTKMRDEHLAGLRPLEDRQAALDLTGSSIVREIFSNLGLVMGGMFYDATSQETLGLAAVGGAVGGGAGAAAGGVGALPGAAAGAGKGFIAGIGLTSGMSASGRLAMAVLDSQPDGQKDPELAIKYGLGFGLVYGGLNIYGVKAMAMGTPWLRGKIAGAAAAAVPKAAERIGLMMAGQNLSGVAVRAGANVLEHMGPEVGVNALQSGLEVTGQMAAAEEFNQKYGTNIPVPGWDDVGRATYEGGRMAILGGAFLGLARPAWRAVGDWANVSLAARQQSLIRAGEKVANLTAQEEVVKQATDDIRQTARKTVEILRNDPEISANPEMAEAALASLGEGRAYVDPEVLVSLHQDGLGGLPDHEAAAETAALLGVDRESFFEALNNGTDLALDLRHLDKVARDKGLDPILDKLTAEPRHITEERAAEVERLIARPLENDPFLDFELPPEMTEEIKKQVAGELEAAGMPAEQARTQADLLTRLLAKPLAAMGVKDIGRWFQERLQIVRKQAGNAEGEGGQVLHQPMNEGLDIDRPVRTVFAEDRLPAGEWYQLTKGTLRVDVAKDVATIDIENDNLKTRLKPSYVNAADTQWAIDISVGDAKHAAGRVNRSKFDKRHHMQAVAHLPELIREMVLVESHADAKSEAGLKAVHRFYAPFEADGTPYSVKITVKEFESGVRIAEIEDLKRAYSLSLEKEMPGQGSTPSIRNLDGAHQPGLVERGQPGSTPKSEYSIRELIEAVNDSEGQPYLQNSGNKPGPRGMLETLADGTFRITLFEGAADASTPVHESAHLFVEVMREVLATSPEHVSDWIAFEGAHNEFVRLAEWAGQKDPYGQWSTEAHEKLARGFEAYLMEGRAPAEGLRGIFAKMKDWLLGIYKDTRKLNVELTDEVREVFDRLLATDEEVFLEATRLDEPKGLSPEIRAELAPEYAAARAAQEEAIRKKRMAEAKKMKGQWAKEGQAEADNHPHQRRLDDIVNEGGINPESLEAGGYTKADIQALSRRRPGLVNKESRRGYDELAERYGMDGDDFVRSLIEGPTKKDLVKQYMDSQEAKWAEYFAEDAPISDAEIKLRILELEAAKREKQSAAEAAKALRDVRKQLNKPGGLSRYKSAILKRTGLRPVGDAEAMNMRDLKLSLAAEERGAREGYRAGKSEGRKATREAVRETKEKSRAETAAKVLDMAVQFQIKQQIRSEMLKFEQLARRIVDSKPGRYYETKGLDPEYHAQLRQLLGQFGIGTGDREGTPGLAGFIAEARERNETVHVAEWIEKGQWPVWENGQWAGRPKGWKSLTYDQFRDLADAVDNLRHLGRARRLMMVGGELMDLKALAGAINKQIHANNEVAPAKSHKEIIEGKFDREGAFKSFAENVKGLNAALIKVETITRVLDGGQVDGLTGQAIFGRVHEGWQTAAELGEMASARLKEIVAGTIGEKALRKMRGEKVLIEGFPLNLYREQLVALVLNSGNEGNLKSLMAIDTDGKGNTLTMEHIQKAREALSPEEMNFVQEVWDFLDKEMYPRLDALEKRRSGLSLKKVEAAGFSTRHGEYRGGYYPLSFDTEIGQRAHVNQEKAANRDQMSGTSHRVSIKSGATHERVMTSYKDLVPLLNLEVLSRSLNENIHDLAYSEAVRDVQKLINLPEVKDAIAGALGKQYWDQIPLWLQDVARPNGKDKIGLESINKGLRKIRNNLAVSALGLKVVVMFSQLTGFSQTIQLMGAKDFMSGVMAHFGDLKNSADFIYKESVEVRNRNRTGHDRDIADATRPRNLFYKSVKEKIGEAAFKPIALTDQMLANCIWQGGYLKAMREGKNHGQAVYYADAMVRNTQPFGGIKDQSHVQRGAGWGDVGKLLTMYYSFFSGTHNLAWEQSKYSARDWKAGQKGKAAFGAARAAFLLWMLPALCEQLVRGEMPEDGEDWDDWLNELGKGVVSMSVSGLPVVKDLTSRLLGKSPRFQPAPAIEVPEAVFGGVDAAMKLLGDDGEYKDARSLVKGLGPVTGLPTGQAMVTMDGVHDWSDDESTMENLWHLLVRRPFEK